MKIVDKTKSKKISPEEMYQVGNVIKHFSDYFLVVESQYKYYRMVNLSTNLYTPKQFDSIEKLVEECYSPDDELVDAELVIN